MTRELVVLMDGVVAGTVVEQNRVSTFTYDPAYRRLDGATPVSVGMPMDIERHDGVDAWLWGLLPDNADVIGRWAREFQASAGSAVSLLSTPVGHDCSGAVQFAREGDVDLLIARRGDVLWLTEEEVADRLRDLVVDRTSWLGRSNPGQFSLAGAQAKTALLQDGDRWGVPSGAAATSHILKPPIEGLEDQDVNEHVCLAAAREAGLPAVPTSIREFAGITAIVVTRYDRIQRGGSLARVHQEDLCQAMGIPPTDKYEVDGGPSAARIIQLLRRTLAPTIADASIDRFVDALAWNWIIGGTDAHAKNYSLLLAGSQVRLAPLYDVASALPYFDERNRKLKMAMRVGREYRIYPWHDPWPRAAIDWGLDAAKVSARVASLIDRAPDAFQAVAETVEAAGLASGMPTRLSDIIAERAPRLLAVLD